MLFVKDQQLRRGRVRAPNVRMIHYQKVKAKYETRKRNYVLDESQENDYSQTDAESLSFARGSSYCA